MTLGILGALLFSSAQALAVKPPPKPPSLKVSAIVSGFNTTLNYQVNVEVSKIVSQDCVLTFPNGLSGHGCDFTSNQGSGAKLTKFSITSGTPQAGSYTFEVAMDLAGGGHVSASTGFSVAPGPAVRFSVTGLVAQPAVCYVGIDCVGFPQPSYPRQIATIKALDVNDNVATGYAGTVTFENPITHATPSGLSNMTLTDGVAYVPVLVPDLSLGFNEPACPAGPTGNGVVLTAMDTLDNTIFGCQNIPGGTLELVFPEGFFDAPSIDCLTGCFDEPTDNITINTNSLTPSSLSSTVLSDGSILLTGQTIANLYFTQSIELGTLYLEGPSMPSGTFGPCSGCSSFNILVNAIIIDQTTDASDDIVLDDNHLIVGGCELFPWEEEGPDPCLQATADFLPVTTTVITAAPPTCYLEPQLLTLVNLEECN